MQENDLRILQVFIFPYINIFLPDNNYSRPRRRVYVLAPGFFSFLFVIEVLRDITCVGADISAT